VLPNYWIWLAAGLAISVLLIALIVLRWRRRRSDIAGALHAVTIQRLHDVLAPDGMGGHIQIEYLILTAHGILVIDVKRVEGVVFASDRMNEWTVMSKQGRFTFPNPQSTLYDRVAAIRQVLRDVQVAGFVVFPNAADFSKGRPKDVLLARELAEQYKKPEKSAVERIVLGIAPHWERSRETVKPAPKRSPKRL
jgi:hypothetical protein